MSVHGTSNTLKGFTENDILIEPDMKGVGSLDFHRAKEAVALGEAAAHKLDDQLATLARYLQVGPYSAAERLPDRIKL